MVETQIPAVPSQAELSQAGRCNGKTALVFSTGALAWDEPGPVSMLTSANIFPLRTSNNIKTVIMNFTTKVLTLAPLNKDIIESAPILLQYTLPCL